MIALTNKPFLLSKIGNLVSFGNNEFCNLPLTRSKPFLSRNTHKLFPNSLSCYYSKSIFVPF